jgi:hypothetical protein
MNAFQQYLAHQLDEHLKKCRIVVWYDPNAEFDPFIAELPDATDGSVQIGSQRVQLARYAGSFFGLRLEVEGHIAGVLPDPLLIYLPGVTRDRMHSVLMELEKAGSCYEPQLKRLARNVMRESMTDGHIDEILAPEKVTYADIVHVLAQSDAGGSQPSNLKLVYPHTTDSTGLLAGWVIDESNDKKIQEKQAEAELYKLIESRLGLTVDVAVPVPKARDQAVRYLFANEFRADLKGDAPTSLAMIAEPASVDQAKRISDILFRLRKDHAQDYIRLADQVEQALQLAQADIAPGALGAIDTFRLEESLLLAYCGELLCDKKYKEAMVLVEGRTDSFWVLHDVNRQAQWEVCRLMSELGQTIERIRPEIEKCGSNPENWVRSYCRPGDGWHQLDLLQRSLESWVSKMEEDPETEQAVAVLRQETESLLKKMMEGFTQALRKADWAVHGYLHQTHIYPDIVEGSKERTALFLVDAMRFEMGVDLSRRLQQVEDLTVQSAIAMLPTITSVGMGALLPGASSSFSVVEHKDNVASKIHSSILPGVNERLKLLKAQVPGVKEMTLGKVMQSSTAKLAKDIDEAPLVVIRSQEIDNLGESDGDWLARQLMDSVLGNLARAVKKLAAAGIERFVLTADHGYQFSLRKEEDMRIDAPGGDTVECHRRCWIGRGGNTPPGTVRVAGSELGYTTDLDFIFPMGLGVFKAGGGLAYHHGGLSLQEMVVPVVSMRIPRTERVAATTTQVIVSGYPTKLTNRTFGITLTVSADIFETETLSLRLILVSGGEQVGQAGMASGDHFDRKSGCVRVAPGDQVSIGLLLTRDDCTSCKLVVQDSFTDAVLMQTDELPIKLGM